jgi:hypothetical protein
MITRGLEGSLPWVSTLEDFQRKPFLDEQKVLKNDILVH